MIRSIRLVAVFAATMIFILATGCATIKNADYGSILGSGTGAGLDEATVLAGLKDALKVGSQNAVVSTSSVDGFLGNAMIRIAMPDQLRPKLDRCLAQPCTVPGQPFI